MTVEAVGSARPEAPRRAIVLVPALLVAVFAFWVGGLFGDVGGGLVWGVVAGGGLVLAGRSARLGLDPLTELTLGIGAIVSTLLTVATISETPDAIDVSLVLRFGIAWAPLGLAASFAAWRGGAKAARVAAPAVVFVFGGMLGLAAAQAFDVVIPLTEFAATEFSNGFYAFVGAAVALVGASALLAATTGLMGIVSGGLVIALTGFAAAQVGVGFADLVRDAVGEGNTWWWPLSWNFEGFRQVSFFPPDFEWAVGTGDWWWLPSWDFGSEVLPNPLIETFRIAIIATILGTTVALPVAFLASKITAPNGPIYLVDKGFMNVIRTIPDLFWALIFTTALGIGPFAGAIALVIFSMAIMSKLLSETIDAVDPGPLEAAKATGSSHFPAVRSSVFPQVLPNYIAYALYIFEINIRASVVLGVVGAGGIGRVLEAQRGFFNFDRVMAIVIVIFGIVFIIEQISVFFRRRLV